MSEQICELVYECSARTRAHVWERLYGAQFASHYYQSLANGFLRWHRRLMFTILILGVGAAVPAILNLIAGVSGYGDSSSSLLAAAVVGVALAVCSGMMVVGDFARKASGSMSISIVCARVADDLLELLSQMDQYKIPDAQAREEMHSLYRKVRDETYSSEKLGIVINTEKASFTDAEAQALEYMEHLKGTYAYGQ